MRISTAYFAGVGTVVAAIAIGAGGGFTIARIMNPHETKQEVSQADRRTGSEQARMPTASPEPGAYLAATQEAATKPVTVTPAPQQPQQPQESQPSQPNIVATTPPEPAAAPDSAQQASSPAPSPQTAAREPSAMSETRNANARAREADVRRAAAEKRRAERHQRWAERRRVRQDDDLRDVEQRVREATDGPRLLAADPVRAETPRMGLFETDDE